MSNNKRSGKFYRNNEKEIMDRLGFNSTPNSGSGWIWKEDGQNEDAICQLKSTDAKSIRINQKDIEILEYNALVCHKIPIFVIQFLNTDEIFLIIRPVNLADTLRVMKGERPRDIQSDFLGLTVEDVGVQDDILNMDLKSKSNGKTVIKSSSDSRQSFMEENAERYKKKSKSAR